MRPDIIIEMSMDSHTPKVFFLYCHPLFSSSVRGNMESNMFFSFSHAPVCHGWTHIEETHGSLVNSTQLV